MKIQLSRIINSLSEIWLPRFMIISYLKAANGAPLPREGEDIVIEVQRSINNPQVKGIDI